jgi:hypothetical protein
MGALLRPALDAGRAAGAVDGGGRNGSSMAFSASASASEASSRASKGGAGLLIHPCAKEEVGGNRDILRACNCIS